MQQSVRYALLSASLLVAACSHTPPPVANAAPPAPPPVLAQVDQNFVQIVAIGDAFEIQSSQLVNDRTHSPAIKKLAAKMVQAHTGTTQQLNQIVSSKNVQPATAQPGDDQQKALATLQGEHGRRFDRDYLHGLLKTHETAAMAFKKEIAEGQDAEIKAFAQQTLPAIEEHIAEIRRLCGIRMAHMAHHRDHDMGDEMPESSAMHY